MKYAFLVVIAAMMLGCPKKVVKDEPAPTAEDAAVVQCKDGGTEDSAAEDAAVLPEG